MDSRMFPYIESVAIPMVGVDDVAVGDDVEEALEYIVEDGAVLAVVDDAAGTLVGAEALEVFVDEPQAAVSMAIPTASETPVVFLIRSTFRPWSQRHLGDDVLFYGHIRPGLPNGLKR
ncbi:MAG: hypothetical protein ACP5P1_02600 [Acidimicrobiales bacterium]